MILAAIITFIIVLGLLIFVHELGHFVMARKAGMDVQEFGFGFPPKMFGIRRGSTTYSINWIPLGGFVRILGEDGQHRDDPNSFGSKTITKRFLVLVAGVVMNMILAWVLLSINNVIGVPTAIAPEDALHTASMTQITTVAPGSPAEEVGLRTGDTIHFINNQEVANTTAAIATIRENQGEEVAITIQSGNTEQILRVTPRLNPPENEGALGIGLADITLEKNPWYLAPVLGLSDTALLTWRIVTGFGLLIKGIFIQEGNVAGSVAGPLGIAALTKQVSEMGIQYLIQFTALLSVNLAIINILPLPALDGGRILFLVIEKIKGSPVKKEREGLIHTIGFGSLLVLMVVVTFLDIMKFKDSILSLFSGIF